jgi:hypothetical protein
MVTRAALQNAASIAGLSATTDGMIAEAPEEKREGGVPGGGTGGICNLKFQMSDLKFLFWVARLSNPQSTKGFVTRRGLSLFLKNGQRLPARCDTPISDDLVRTADEHPLAALE